MRWWGIAFAVAALSASACAAHRQLGRPPSTDDLSAISATAASGGPVRVVYVRPIGTCAAGACADAPPPPMHPIAIEVRDPSALTLRLADGATQTVPFASIEAVRVRGPAAVPVATGVAIGAAIGVPVGLWATDGCRGDCWYLFAGSVVLPALIGGGLGWLSSDNVYTFGPPEPRR